MILRIAFFILMAVALVGFGVVAWVTLRPQMPVQMAQTTPAPVAKPAEIKVLVAARTVAAGGLLKPEDFVIRAVPSAKAAGAISADASDATRAIAGAMAKHILTVGDPIRDDDIVRPSDHGFMAAALQPGMRAVTIAVDAASGSAGLVWPGDRVDVILTQTLNDPSLPIGQRVSAETILTNARVIAIDQQLMQGAAPTPNNSQNQTVTLEVTPEDVQRVSVAKQLGRLSLSVRAVPPAGGNAADASPRGGSVYARDVSSAYARDPAPPPAPAPQERTIHVFHGSSDPKEFKY